jgi:transcriptional regulator with XRE-family HTH domain
MSSLERGIKSPTISKIEELASVIGVHPLSLLALAYLPPLADDRTALCSKICDEIQALIISQAEL